MWCYWEHGPCTSYADIGFNLYEVTEVADPGGSGETEDSGETDGTEDGSAENTVDTGSNPDTPTDSNDPP